MNRFSSEKKKLFFPKKLLASCTLFILCALIFWYGIDSVSDTTEQSQIDSLKRTITRSSVHCYAVEGAYPESLTYLQDFYGITWDADHYMVDYEITGSNMMPDIRVIPKNSWEVPR